MAEIKTIYGIPIADTTSRSDIATNTANDEEQAEAISTNASDIADLKSAVSSADELNTTQSENINQNASDIATLQAALETLQSTVSSNNVFYVEVATYSDGGGNVLNE